ncbi:VRR-NUC domain-containing protein [Desulforamulus ruminis]|uniref:VRR-NUC domain-containing protein n=1 Tax=Desulforamulus ruminis TaxID=1564 RepID=UPI00235657F1|nr:VRR-NUC domain-containing protein [Desulforamulus ruminis]
MGCNHEKVICLNPYELIRKYQCEACREVMMCECEQEFAIKYLPHQLDFAQELGTRNRLPVTIGFQKHVCNKCKGLPEMITPVAEGYGRTTKIVRYYWREIFFETTRRFGEWLNGRDNIDWLVAVSKYRDVHKEIEKKVIEEIKKLHQVAPKYTFQEESQQEIITKYRVEIINLDGCYVKQDSGRVKLFKDGALFSVEQYVTEHFKEQGYKVLFTESVPFHVLFGVLMWSLIQHHSDPKNRPVGFGDRNAFDKGVPGDIVWAILPEDFGTSEYAERRARKIAEHLNALPNDKDELLWTFDHWIEPSAPLRQYLWAHRQNDIQITRKIVEILPIKAIIKILNYLAGDYWHRFCGWPDLLVYNDHNFFFVEVKSSGDSLSEDQKNWIRGNSEHLQLPFKLIKVHKKKVIGLGQE